MNKLKTLPLTALAMFILMALPVFAGAVTVTFVSPTPANGVNLSQAYMFINVTSNETIINTSTTYIEWINNSNVGLNITPASAMGLRIQNSTDCVANACYVYFNITGLANGRHLFRVSINASTGAQINVTNVTATRNISLDTVAPSLTVDQPTASQSLNPTDTGRVTIDLNTTITDATAGLDVCRYAIGRSNTGSTVIDVSNTSFTCGTSTAITPNPSGGSNVLFVYANDSAGNLQQTTVSFNYAIVTTGGGIVGGGGGGTFVPSTPPIKPVVQPSGTTEPVAPALESENNNLLIWVVVIAVGYYLFKGNKKKRKR